MAKQIGLWIMLLLINASIALGSPLEGSPLLIGPGVSHQQMIPIDQESTYAFTLWVQGSLVNAVVSLSVQLLDANGSQVGVAKVYRGIGDPAQWYPLGVEITSPKSVITARITLTADRKGDYRWNALSVVKLDTSVDGIREFWEEKFELYGQVYTGLVIDGRGQGLLRGMSPRVVSESGQLIYGGISATYEYVQNIGLVAYGPELSNALFSRIQVDESYPLAVPLVLEAIAVEGMSRTNAVISDQAAEEILTALAAYDFLARFAVIFLVD